MLIGTQGFEQKVLLGCPTKLKEVRALQLEMSVHPLYEGQASFFQMIEFVASCGFVIAGLNPSWNHPKSGELLELDAFFLNSDLPAASS